MHSTCFKEELKPVYLLSYVCKIVIFKFGYGNHTKQHGTGHLHMMPYVFVLELKGVYLSIARHDENSSFRSILQPCSIPIRICSFL